LDGSRLYSTKTVSPAHGAKWCKMVQIAEIGFKQRFERGFMVKEYFKS